MSKYKNRVKPISRNTGDPHGMVTDGDLFVPDWSKMYYEDINYVYGLDRLMNCHEKCIIEFRWDYVADAVEEWKRSRATLFVVREDGKRLESNVLMNGRFNVGSRNLLSRLMRYDPTIRSKKPKRKKRGW